MKSNSDTFVRTFVRGGGGNLVTNLYNTKKNRKSSSIVFAIGLFHV